MKRYKLRNWQEPRIRFGSDGRCARVTAVAPATIQYRSWRAHGRGQIRRADAVAIVIDAVISRGTANVVVIVVIDWRGA